jgi:hypothetical protein
MKTKSITVFLSVAFVMAMVLSGCSTQSSAKVNVSADRTPAEVVDSFYQWYIGYAGNPLADGAYRSNEHLTEAFVIRVEEIIAAFDKGGYDPFLCAQDIPGSFSIGEENVSGEEATVGLTEVWNPDTEYESYSQVKVALKLEGETWKITGIDCGRPAATAPIVMTPEEVVDRFYNWYLDYIGEPGSEEMRNPLSERAYRSSGFLTETFVKKVDEIVASNGYFPYDPFLCAQDIPRNLNLEGSEISGETTEVTVTTNFPGHSFTAELEQVNGEWKIANVACGGSAQDTAEPISPMPEGPAIATPEGTIDAFYSWYLWYVREVGNPLVDGAYRSNEYLSAGLVQKADAILASFDKGGFDPFLCAQDIPQSITIEDAVMSGDIARSVVRTNFQGHGFTVALQRIDGRWEIGDILCEIEETDKDGASTGSTRVKDWQLLTDDQYGFQIQYPSDWVPQEVELRYPELDAPTVRIVQFLPQEWAQRMNTGGRPDPNNIIVAPLSLEVSVGTLEAYQAKYPEPASSETVEINGYTVAREREVAGDFGMIRYVFQHPTNDDLRVTLIDQIGGFSTRVEGNEDVADILQQILGTFAFDK